jgi:hypothetical protein
LRRNLGLLSVLLLTAAAYRPLNRRPSRRVLWTKADDAIPLLPALTFPYLAFLPVYWGTIVAACLRDDRRFGQLALTASLVYTTSNVVYLVFQTHMPRPDEVPDGPGAWLLRRVYEQDEPYCDFPSEHASSAVMLALYVNAAHRPGRVPVTALALSVLPATLVTKQHTIAGMLGGATLAALAWPLVGRQLRPE